MAEGIFIPDMVEEDDGGIAAKHPNTFVLPLVVAPAPEDKPDAFNSVRNTLVTVACKDVPDAHFEFDRSFVAPEAKKAFVALHGVIKRHDDSPLAIWGHADPEGSIEYNQFLSERRAEAVFAILIRDIDRWEKLFSSQAARGKAIGDVWGDESIAKILTTLGFPPDDAQKDPLKDQIIRFETARGDAKPAGKNDAALRKRIFPEYMDAICVDKDGKPYKLTRENFLGKEMDAKQGEIASFQGCSEFNPQLILAKAETDAFAKDKQFGKQLRHEANRDNRRVMIFFFAPGTKGPVLPDLWPCPRAKDGLKKCQAHLFSDHKDRTEKQFPLRRRRFGKQVRNETERMSRPEMTFGCRFYHGLAQRSPCERDLQMFAVQLLMDAPKRPGVDGAERLVPVQNVRFVCLLGENDQVSAVVRGRTTQQGMIGIPFLSPLSTMKLKVDIAAAIVGGIPLEVPEDPSTRPKSADTDAFEDEDTFIVYDLRPDRLFRLKKKEVPGILPDIPDEKASLEPDADEPDVSDEELRLGARQRLFNLGFGSGLAEVMPEPEFKRNLSRFQKNARLANTDGTLDQPTIDELHKQHGS
jgi:OmpA family protein